MNSIRLTAACAIVLAIALSGCARTAPIMNIDAAQVTPSSGKALSASQVRAAIITAGTSMGWRMTDGGSGRIEGTLSLRAHTAVVDIPYTATTYGIKFKRADNLKAGDDGTVHSNYNGWVQNLDRAIRTEISRL